jgi:hypothetical protein
MNKIHNFVVTHKTLEYSIPFPHLLVGLDGYKSLDCLDISNSIPDYMNQDRTFACYRAGWGILKYLNDRNTDVSDYLAIYSYRSFFGNDFQNNMLELTNENQNRDLIGSGSFRSFFTPLEFYNSWKSELLDHVPECVELVTTRPIQFPASFSSQYAHCHHFEDLMFGLGIAIRVGCIDPKVTAQFLSSNIFIHGFVGKISFWQDLYQKLFLIADEFYKKHYIIRSGYQARSINFVLERIVSLYLMQKIYYENVSAANVNLIQISDNGKYVPGI